MTMNDFKAILSMTDDELLVYSDHIRETTQDDNLADQLVKIANGSVAEKKNLKRQFLYAEIKKQRKTS